MTALPFSFQTLAKLLYRAAEEQVIADPLKVQDILGYQKRNQILQVCFHFVNSTAVLYIDDKMKETRLFRPVVKPELICGN